MEHVTALAATLLVGVALAAPTTNDWENLKVNSRNRLPARTYAMPLADEAAALTDALDPETPFKKSLNGVWKFSWAGNPELRVKDFWKEGFDDSDWFTIDVPSCVEMRGFGVTGYTNIRYPHAWDPKRDAKAPTIRDRDTDARDYNPVSSYRTTFTVPESWKGRDVILRFDGVYSAYYVWVNGRLVGYAEDSKLPSEFDITRYLKVEANTLAVEVYRWCDGSFVEDQDMLRYSGIFRDVTLWAKPKDGIWDFAVKTVALDAGYERWRLEVEVENGGEASSPVEAKLYDSGMRLVGSFALDGGIGDAALPHDDGTADGGDGLTGSLVGRHLRCRRSSKGGIVLDGVKTWSAEKPYLYTLVLKKGDDVRMKRVGFKEQKIVNGVFLVNGQPVKFKGVNRHETSPENGRTVSLDEMMTDITLFKRYNVNTVRTSHYPNHHLWYDLCDRYGIYVVAEANVEGHGADYAAGAIGRNPEWDWTVVERNERNVTFYRNNPSVTIWSAGNETGHGDCFRHAIAAVKRIDPSRPVHWERGNADADMDSKMYPSVEWLEERGQLGDGRIDFMKLADKDVACTQEKGKCFFLCEYAHAMGNAVGNFQEYWDAFYAHPSLAGGCVWEWVDHAVWKAVDRVDPKTGKQERFLAHGGDFDENPNDGNFCDDGIVTPTREVSAKLLEIAHVHRNLVVTRAEKAGDNPYAVVFELWNRFLFTRADEFAASWELLEDGVATKRGAFETPAVATLSRCRFTVPGLAEALAAARPGAELFVNFAFATKAATELVPKGWAVARDQVALGGAWDFAKAAGAMGSSRPTGDAANGAMGSSRPTDGAGGSHFSATADGGAPRTSRPTGGTVDGAMGSSRPTDDANGRVGAPTPTAAANGVAIEPGETLVTVTAGLTRAVFSRASGTLCELVMNERTILRDPAPGVVAGPLLTCVRAFTDNDAWMRQGNLWRSDLKRGSVFSRGLTQLRYHPRPLAVRDGTVVVTTEVTGRKSAGFTHEAAWSFAADGAVTVENVVTPHGTMPPAIPRLGLSLQLDPALETVEYYGRGPRENYVDRKTASFLGRWTSPVDGLAETYLRPQDNGCRSDVRWVSLTAKDGTGVRFAASEPLFFTASHYGWEDLDFARHRRDQQRFRALPAPRKEVMLNLDVRQVGLGGASCGPEPMRKYLFPIERTAWTLRMEPVK